MRRFSGPNKKTIGIEDHVDHVKDGIRIQFIDPKDVDINSNGEQTKDPGPNLLFGEQVNAKDATDGCCPLDI